MADAPKEQSRKNDGDLLRGAAQRLNPIPKPRISMYVAAAEKSISPRDNGNGWGWGRLRISRRMSKNTELSNRAKFSKKAASIWGTTVSGRWRKTDSNFGTTDGGTTAHQKEPKYTSTSKNNKSTTPQRRNRAQTQESHGKRHRSRSNTKHSQSKNNRAKPVAPKKAQTMNDTATTPPPTRVMEKQVPAVWPMEKPRKKVVKSFRQAVQHRIGVAKIVKQWPPVRFSVVRTPYTETAKSLEKSTPKLPIIPNTVSEVVIQRPTAAEELAGMNRPVERWVKQWDRKLTTPGDNL